jgi:glycosyltransferase involved in cell wall biosynthesis
MDPDYGPSLRKKHSKLVQSGHISFMGAITKRQLYEEISRCSLLCLPSLAESKPMVIAEAMAAGKPVVASNVGGIPEMVEDGSTGELCEPGNETALSQLLIELLADPKKCQSMGIRARQKAQSEYHPLTIAAKTYKAYCTLLGMETN